MKKTILAGVFLSVSLFASFLEAEDQIVASVNDHPITQAKLSQAINPYKNQIAGSETVYLKVRERVINQLIENELLLQEAINKKVVVAPEEIEQIMGVIRARFKAEEDFNLALKMAELDEAALRKNIQEKLMRLKIADWTVKGKLQISQERFDDFCHNYGLKVDCQHILVKTEKEALDLLHQAQAGVDFSKLAKENSLCPSSQVGGDLGFFGRGKMVKEFEEAAFTMNKQGELSGVVKTQFGYHIIRFIAKQDPSPKELQEIKEGLINELSGRTYLVIGEGLDFETKRILEERFIGQELKTGYNQWLVELKAKARITLSEEVDSPAKAPLPPPRN